MLQRLDDLQILAHGLDVVFCISECKFTVSNIFQVSSATMIVRSAGLF